MSALQVILVGFLAVAQVARASPPSHRAPLPTILEVTPSQWTSLNESINGRLHLNNPLGLSCYSDSSPTYAKAEAHSPNLVQCSILEENRTTGTYLANQPSGYLYGDISFCQATGEGCPLRYSSPDTPLPIPGTCHQGAVPDYYIDVRSVSDVQRGLAFANSHHLPLVIKNTGHDHKGRSAGPNSLALWTHNVQPDINFTTGFVPNGCLSPIGNVVTFGAGQQFDGIYQVAQQNNVTVVGGSSATVGAAGGWITGGGHSALSVKLGLGVDNVQQLRAVLPNGTYITANRCQNQDLFFALRGGGGGTFGIIMEMTTLTHPIQRLGFGAFTFKRLTSSTTKELLEIVVSNAAKCRGSLNVFADISGSSEGFGGYFLPGAANPLIALMSPLMNEAQTKTTLKPLIDFAARQGNLSVLSTVITASYHEIYTNYLKEALENSSGVAAAQSSRLIPMHNFVGKKSQTTLINTLADLLDSSITTSRVPSQPLFINILGPVLFDVPASDLPGGPGYASVTPAWRTSPWHVIHQRLWDPADTTVGGAGSYANAYQLAQDETAGLRALVPDGGSYQNEADINEPDAIDMFWGKENYQRLLKIKKEVDPSNLLTVHQGVGWDPKAARFCCYTKP